MATVDITLKDGSVKTVDIDDNFTDEDIDEIANDLNSTLSNNTQPVLTGNVQQNIREELDKKGRSHFIDVDTGKEIKSNLNPLQKAGRKLKATGENIRSFMSQDYGEPLKARQKAGAMVLSSLLPAGQGLLPMIGAGALGGGLYSSAEQYIDEGKINPLQTGVDAVIGGLTGGLVHGGTRLVTNKINRIKRANALKARKNTPLADRMKQEVLDEMTIPEADLNYNSMPENQLDEATRPKTTVDEYGVTDEELDALTSQGVAPSQYGVEDNADINQNIANKMNDDVISAMREIQDYKTHLKEFNKKYGDLNKARKQLAEQSDEYGRVEDADLQQAFDRLLEHQKQLQNSSNPYLKDATNIDARYKELKNAAKKNYKSYTEKSNVNEAPIIKEPFAGDVTAEGAEMPTLAQTADNTISEPPISEKVAQEAPKSFDDKKVRQSAQTVLEQTNYDPQIASLIEDNPELKYYNPINLKQKVQDLSKLSNEELSAKALSENNDIDNVVSRKILLENGLKNKNINYALLDKTITGGTEQAQAFVARKIMNIGTPEGALIATRKAIIDTLPKKTRDVLKNGGKIAKKILSNEEKASKILDKYGIQGKNQKIILNKLEKLNKLGQLNEETVYTALCDGYKVKNLSDTQIAEITKLSENIANATTDREKIIAEQLFWKNVNKIAPNFWKKVSQADQTYRTMNMLFSPKSRMKDVVGTALYQGERVLDELAAQGISLISRGLGYKTRALGLDNAAWRGGLKRGTKEVLEDAKLGINSGRSGEGSRYDLGNYPSFENVPVLKQVEQLLNLSIKGIDRPFYEAAYEASLANQMRAAGVTEPTQEMIEQAVLEGKQAVFQRNSALSKAGMSIRDTLNNIAPNLNLGQRNIPFLQTIANLTQEGINATPLTAPQNIYKYAKALNSGDIGAIRDAELSLGKNIKGALLYGPLGYLAAQNPDKNNIGELQNAFDVESEVTGEPEQSFQLGNQYYSIANLPQTSIPMALYKALFTQGSPLQKVGGATRSVIDAFASLPANQTLGTLVRGSGDIYEAATQAEEGKDIDAGLQEASKVGKQLVSNLLSQYIPLGGTLGNIRNIVDKNKRELSSDSFWGYVGNRLKNRIPFASKTLPPKYDVTGEEVLNNNIENDTLRSVSELIDPFNIRNVELTPKVIQYLDALTDFAKENDVTGKTTLQLQKAKKYIGKKKATRINLTGEQYAEYSKNLQTALYEMKNDLINDINFTSLPEEEQIKVIRKMQKQIKDEVELDMVKKIYGEL